MTTTATAPTGPTSPRRLLAPGRGGEQAARGSAAPRTSRRGRFRSRAWRTACATAATARTSRVGVCRAATLARRCRRPRRLEVASASAVRGCGRSTRRRRRRGLRSWRRRAASRCCAPRARPLSGRSPGDVSRPPHSSRRFAPPLLAPLPPLACPSPPLPPSLLSHSPSLAGRRRRVRVRGLPLQPRDPARERQGESCLLPRAGVGLGDRRRRGCAARRGQVRRRPEAVGPHHVRVRGEREARASERAIHLRLRHDPRHARRVLRFVRCGALAMFT